MKIKSFQSIKIYKMKNLLLLVCFVALGSMSANAQCSKSKTAACCAKKGATSEASATSADTKVASASMTADITAAETLASTDESIQKRVDASTGEVKFFQKATCETTGNVKWSEVSYCDKSNKFTQVASASMESEVEAVSGDAKDVKKACCAGKKGAKCDKKVNE